MMTTRQLDHRLTQSMTMVVRMTFYGMVLGALAGFLLKWTNITLLFTDSISTFVSAVVLALIPGCIGSIMGGLYGGAAGLMSGLIMCTATATGFPVIHDVRRYMLTMGTITAGMSSGVFLLGYRWVFGQSGYLTGISTILIAIVMAVYVSQLVAKQHINEIAVRKKKGEA